uniref:Ion transport domain-containing protein n=1 Tax=Plectus sambesii TaxID=2011161 RepID=A0A914W4G7_9BILA
MASLSKKIFDRQSLFLLSLESSQPRSLQKPPPSRQRQKSEGRDKDGNSSRSTKGRVAGVFQPCRTSSLPPLPNVPSPVSSIVSVYEEQVPEEIEASHPNETKKNIRVTSAKSIVPSKMHEDDVAAPVVTKKKKKKKNQWNVTVIDRQVPQISLPLEDVEVKEEVVPALQQSLLRHRPSSPRPTGDIFPVVNVHADQISQAGTLEVPGRKSIRSVSLYSTDDSIRLPLGLDDNDSRLSFIVREKLHALAKKIHRRTSDVKQHIRRAPTPEDDRASVASTGGAGSAMDQHRRSLMSFIGFSRATASSMSQYSDLRPEYLERLLHMSPARRFWEEHIRRKLNRLVPSSVDPNSKKYLTWLAIVTLSFLYNAYAIPLRCAYPYQTPTNVGYWILADYTCDAIYLLDLLLIKPRIRFMRGGLAVKEKADMRRHYLMTASFKLDVLSLLPLDILYIWFGCQSYLRAPRILKFMCFGQLFSLAENWVSNAYIIRIGKTLSYMLYIIHCNSCVFYSISAWQAFGQLGYEIDGEWYQDTWVYNNEGNAYIHCFFYTTKLATSIGNNPGPVNVIEYFYMTFSWLMGVFVFAVLLGQIGDIVTNANRNQEHFQPRPRLVHLHLGPAEVTR